jgi:non-specific serine/threonine protein kinase
VLATSREPLHLRWEQRFPIAPLALPAPSRSSTLDTVAQSPAVALFVLRAQAVQPDFTLDADNASEVAQLCTALDGLPLAIELAASWAHALDPASLRARMSLAHLGTSVRDMPERHHTLRAAMQWSYDLLTVSEQRVLRCIGVFAGSFTIEAVEAVCDVQDAVLPDLISLFDKSLVGRADRTRFRLLETVRAFALEQLASCGEALDARRRHAEYYAGLVDRLSPDGDLDNLRAAVRFALDVGPPELGLHIAAQFYLWQLSGNPSEARTYLQLLLQRTPIESPGRPEALHAAFGLAMWQGDYAAARRAVEDNDEHHRRLGKSTFLPNWESGWLALVDGEPEQAEQRFADTLEEASSVDLRCWALFGVGIAARARGDTARALGVLEEALGLARDAVPPTPGIVPPILLKLTYVHLAAGDSNRAAQSLAEAMQPLYRVEGGRGLGRCLMAAGVLAEQLERGVIAARLFGAASSLFRAAGWRADPDEAVDNARALAAARASLGDEFEHAFSDAGTWTVEHAMAEVQAMIDVPAQRSRRSRALDELTSREREVATLIGRGLSSRRIAEELVITVRTADTHADRIRDKLGLRSRAEIAAWAVRNGLR